MFKYPFEEIKSIFSKFENQPFTLSLKEELNFVIDSFLNQLLYKYNVPKEESNQLQLNLVFLNGNTISVDCANLFTACLMYGHYVPLFLVKGLKEFKLQDNSIIKYDYELGSYILIKQNIKTNE